MLRNLLLLASLILLPANGQLVQQCTCAQIESCTHATGEAVLVCADECQQHAGSMKVSYPQLRQCLDNLRSSLDAVFLCFKNTVSLKLCANDTPKMVPARDVETFRQAVFGEVEAVLKQSGIFDQFVAFYLSGKPFLSCYIGCMSRTERKCQEQNNCELDKQSDIVLVHTLKECAIKNGLDTAGFQQLCQCAANAGATQIASLCGSVVVG